ncbi:M48 family metalloprotease [Desulforhopalus vacuolatus]|uniref:M48 family metallopeptidase n=1 Tax=Desulforhopalus vacuolatus TaxID=40414 RepID=UPI001963A348|nr:M48 family metallopeptidase [Desulforhopalus vacuolatus]MBM9520279.1 M48 family metalloprotease [Desulforhopalus vacuolatus]
MYNNIILFIVAIFLFNARGASDQPLLPFFLALPLLVAIFYCWKRAARAIFAWRMRCGDNPCRTETVLSWVALGVFELILFLCEPGWYLARLPLAQTFTAVQGAGGLALFLGLLSVVWVAGRLAMSQVTGIHFTVRQTMVSNLRNTLPILLPWLLISLLYDLVGLFPQSPLRTFLDGIGGFILLAFMVLLLLPTLLRRIWGCTPMPPGEIRDQLEAFCRSQHFTANLFLWPLHEGRAITAAVVGILPGFRAVLLTPALLNLLTVEEREAVLAHEIGHVKKGHLILYLLIIVGFSGIIDVLLDPLSSMLLSWSFPRSIFLALGFSPASSATIVTSIPALLALVLFFRFIFGWFIRNFERQADLYSCKAMGTAAPLISTFEKIARITGTREEKNWHHYGLAERIDFLHRVDADPQLQQAHSRLIYSTIAFWFLIVAVSVGGNIFSPQQDLSVAGGGNMPRFTLEDQALVEHQKRSLVRAAAWYRQLGDVLVERQREAEGIVSYEQSLLLDPTNPVTVNNLAWMLVASHDLALRDPQRALLLALQAVEMQPTGFFYDTLASVYWANGKTDLALEAERKAMRIDPGRTPYYQKQSEKFSVQTYEEAVQHTGELSRELKGKKTKR